MKNIIKEISLSYKSKECSVEKISCSIDAYETARQIYQKSECEIELKEYFYIILLNRANQVLGYHKLGEGGISGTVADIRLAFATALKSVSSAMILVHNHPSGNTTPSEADKKLTHKFKMAGKLLDVDVLDHIILTKDCYGSMADAGLI